MTLIDVVLIALTSSLLLSILDPFYQQSSVRGVLAGLTAVLFSLGGGLVFGYEGWMLFVVTTGAAYVTLFLSVLVERINTVPPTVLDRRR